MGQIRLPKVSRTEELVVTLLTGGQVRSSLTKHIELNYQYGSLSCSMRDKESRRLLHDMQARHG